MADQPQVPETDATEAVQGEPVENTEATEISGASDIMTGAADMATGPSDVVEETVVPVIDDPVVAAVFEGIDGAFVEVHDYASSEVTYHQATVTPDQWVSTVQAAKDNGFDFFIDLYAADHFRDAPRFEVGINLINDVENRRLIISTRLPYDAPTLPTVTGIFAGANFYEREAYDLFGIEFADHPDLTRILLPDDWEGFPLRKDHAVGAIPVQFKAGSVDL